MAWRAGRTTADQAPVTEKSRRGRSVVAALVACAALLGGCESPNDNAGLLVDYLDGSTGHFTGPTQRLEAQLKVDARGCVTVVIDGVERVPFWPSGTRVTDSVEAPGNYTVSLRNGITLTVNAQTGDRFVADGIIDDNPAPFSADPNFPGLVDTMLAFCGVPDPPVAFSDPSTLELK